MKCPWRLFAACLLAETALRCAAGDTSNRTVFVTDPMVVTARGRETPASETPGSVGMIRDDDMATAQAVSIPDMLRLVPGVSRAADSPWGADVNIRGLSRESVILLVDGHRVNTATDLNARFGLIDPLHVERVEILKGPVSSLYGSGSMGGVVNVITRNGRFTEEPEWKSGFSTRVDSNPNGFNTFGFANGNGPNSYGLISQSYRDHASYEDGGGLDVRNSQFRDWTSTMRVGIKPARHYTVAANAQMYEGENIGIPGSGTAPLPAAADVTYPEIRRGLYALTQSLDVNGEHLKKSTVDLYYESIDRRVVIDHFSAASPTLSVRPRADHETIGMRWLNDAEWSAHRVTAGADSWRRKISRSYRERQLRNGQTLVDQPLPNPSWTSTGVFVEDDWRGASRLSLSAGGRVDAIHVENEQSDTWEKRQEDERSWNLHAGGIWRLSDELRLHLVGARSYRAASLEERYQYLELGSGVTQWGDPGLDPEQSLFFECGLAWLGERSSLAVTAFHNRLDDLIGEKKVDAATIVNANINEAEITGCETEGQFYFIRSARLYGNLAWAVGRDTETHEYLPDIAPWNGLAGIRWDGPSGLWVKTETAFAARQDKTPDDMDETPAWETVDVRVGLTRGTDRATHLVFVGVDNLLDVEYRNHLNTWRGTGFNEPGRSFTAGYQGTF